MTQRSNCCAAQHKKLPLALRFQDRSGRLETRSGVYSAGAEPQRPLRVDAVLRYHAQPVPAVIHPVRADAARVVFIEPAWPVTPGQAAVFYDGDTVLGGGRLLKTARGGPSGLARAGR